MPKRKQNLERKRLECLSKKVIDKNSSQEDSKSFILSFILLSNIELKDVCKTVLTRNEDYKELIVNNLIPKMFTSITNITNYHIINQTHPPDLISFLTKIKMKYENFSKPDIYSYENVHDFIQSLITMNYPVSSQNVYSFINYESDEEEDDGNELKIAKLEKDISSLATKLDSINPEKLSKNSSENKEN